MNPLQQKYGEEIERVLAKYPADQKRSAVMPLLYIAQREHGYVTREQLGQIGEIIGVSATDVASIAGRYRIQVCNDLPCALRGADQFLEGLCERLQVKPGGTTADGVVTLEAVMCLAACDKAPMFQVQSHETISYYENQTVDSTMEVLETWQQENGK